MSGFENTLKKTILSFNVWESHIGRHYLSYRFGNTDINKVLSQPPTTKDLVALRKVGTTLTTVAQRKREDKLKTLFNRIDRKYGNRDQKYGNRCAAFYLELLSILSCDIHLLPMFKEVTKEDLEEAKKFKCNLEKTVNSLRRTFEPHLDQQTLTELLSLVDGYADRTKPRQIIPAIAASLKKHKDPMLLPVVEERNGHFRIKKSSATTEAAKTLGKIFILIGYDNISTITRLIQKSFTVVGITSPAYHAIRKQVTSAQKLTANEIREELRNRFQGTFMP